MRRKPVTKPIENRYDFILLFDVKDGNPNGDPDAGNLPRMDPETGHGLVTDVCLKRKVRNYVGLAKSLQSPYDIYVKEKAILGRAHIQAFNKLGIQLGEEDKFPISQEQGESLLQTGLPEGINLSTDTEGNYYIVTALDMDKKTVQEWAKENQLEKQIRDLLSTVLKQTKSRKPRSDEVEKGKAQMCTDFYDVRTFGAVMSLKSAPNCGQVRGPVQMTFARSIDQIVPAEHSITRMAVATEAEADKQQGDNRTMGRKFTVPYALYCSYGFISPLLAAQTGFSSDDLELFWEALKNMFEHDHSAARGLMATQKLITFRHDSALGNAPAHKLFDMVQVSANIETPRAFNDYNITIPSQEDLPPGITIIEML
jgi:CRISPR-associated protein Csd2